MNANPTKADEFDELDRIVAAQPADSYLRAILAKLRDQIRAAIRNDLGFVDFDAHRMQQEHTALDRAILAQRKQQAQLAADIDDKRRQLARLCKDFEQISGDAATIGRTAYERSATLRKALS